MGKKPTDAQVREAKAIHAANWLTLHTQTALAVRKVVSPYLLAQIFDEIKEADEHGQLFGPYIPYASRREAEADEGCTLRWVEIPNSWEGHKGKTHRPVAVVYKKSKTDDSPTLFGGPEEE